MFKEFFSKLNRVISELKKSDSDEFLEEKKNYSSYFVDRTSFRESYFYSKYDCLCGHDVYNHYLYGAECNFRNKCNCWKFRGKQIREKWSLQK